MIFNGRTTANSHLGTAVCLLLCLFTAPIYSQAGDSPKELYLQGVHLYRQADYRDARPLLEKAVQLAPEISTYHHWLGRVYGRLAERSGPLSALALSRKTLEQLRAAVELDDRNVAAIKDLIEYYRRAPAFLGGDDKKAERLAARVAQLEANDITRQGRPGNMSEPPS